MTRIDDVDDRTEGRGRTLALAAGAVVGLLVVAASAAWLGAYQWSRVAGYRSPYLVDLPTPSRTPRLADRVVLVVIDGLRDDTARRLPTFRRLGEEGSRLVARVTPPSLSYPGWTSLVSGAPPEISGVTTNRHEGAARVDTVLASASASGLTTAVVGLPGWRRLFGGVVTEGVYVRDDGEADEDVIRRAVALLRRADPDLLVVHLPDVDHHAHRAGVGDEYLEAALAADRGIARLVEVAGSETAFVVTSDHGHVDAGGHGGAEPVVTRTPLVLSGEGLVPDARGEVEQVDVAPTIAALLGIPVPRHAAATLRVELLDANEETRAQIAEAHDAAGRAFYHAATTYLGAPGETRTAFEAAQRERFEHDLLARLPLSLGAIALFAALLALASGRLDGLAVAAGVGTFLAVWAGLFLGRGGRFSFSELNTEAQIPSYLVERTVEALLAVVAAGIVTGLVAGRRRRAAPSASGLGVAAWAMFVLALGVATFLTLFGWGFAWRLPNVSAAFAELLAIVGIVVLGVGALALAGLAAVVARVVPPRAG
jgi:hypothetical protein